MPRDRPVHGGATLAGPVPARSTPSSTQDTVADDGSSSGDEYQEVYEDSDGADYFVFRPGSGLAIDEANAGVSQAVFYPTARRPTIYDRRISWD